MMATSASIAKEEYDRANELQRRMDVADEMLAKLIDDIGTGPGVASLRKQAYAIKHDICRFPIITDRPTAPSSSRSWGAPST